MTANRIRRRRSNLWHLFFLLLASLCVILGSLYYLNVYVAGNGDNSDLRSNSNSQDSFKAEFRTVPQTVASGRRRIVVLIDSHWHNSDRRFIIRNTWATWQHRLNCSVLFVVGDSDDLTVSDEGAFFQDLLQPTVWENAENAVLKLSAAFRFVQNAFDTDFVLKTRDDVFVNLPGIVDFLKGIGSESDLDRSSTSKGSADELSIMGNRIGHSAAKNRSDALSRLWPEGIPVPDYASGAGYLISLDAMKRLVLCPRIVGLLPLEDVYFTGVCRQHFGIDLHTMTDSN